MKIQSVLFVLTILIVGEVSADKRLVCYWRRIIDGSSIPTKICTHVIFTFVDINELGELGSPSLVAQADLAKLDNLRAESPNLKILICLGIVNEVQRGRMATLISDEAAMQKFSDSAVRFFDKYHVDGIDVDFEFPAIDQVQPFVNFLTHLREAFASKYLLTVAASTNEWRASVSYNISGMISQVDFVNLMTYDMQLYPWPETTGHQSPLFQGPNDKSNWNIDYGLNLWVKQGAPKEKLTIGIPTYGRAYRLADSSENGIGAAATGPGLSSVSYEDLCQKIKANEWTEVWEEDQKVPYAYKDDDWAGHDNIRSVTVKANYLDENSYGGAMFWSVDRDDPNNYCGDGSFPLSTTFRKVFFSDVEQETTANGDTTVTEKGTTAAPVTKKDESTTSAAGSSKLNTLVTVFGLVFLSYLKKIKMFSI